MSPLLVGLQTDHQIKEVGLLKIAAFSVFHQNVPAFWLWGEWIAERASQYNLKQSPGWNVMALTPAVGAAEAGKTPGTVKYIQVSQRQVMPQ